MTTRRLLLFKNDAGVVHRQNTSFPSWIGGFNSLRPLYLFSFTFLVFSLIGCATAPYQSAPVVEIPKPTGGIYHEVNKGQFTWPAEGEVISFFGQRIYGTRNKGIDIKTKNGDKIYASKDGQVVFCSDRFKGHGNIIIIDHLDGFFTVYSRNSQNLVKAGDIVTQNQAIALAGSSGAKNSATYLHFEIRRQGRPHNPFYYLP